MKIFIITMLLSISAWSRLTDSQAVIKTEKDQISITAKKGFHLNKEAPASATFDEQNDFFKPVVKNEKLFVFKIADKARVGTINFYVCDDKKTVCEQHQKTLNFKTGEVKNTETAKPDYQSSKNLDLTSANGKPTLLVFSAPWCPACIRMQTETYNKAEVQKQIKKINFIKLNSDTVENHDLSEKFKIKAIPTMIMLDKAGRETYRWLDFQSSKEFAKNLETQLKKVDQSEEIIKSAQLGEPTAASLLAFKAYNTLDYAEALKWFSLTKSEKDQKYKLASEVLLAQEKAESNEKLIEEYIETLQKAIALTPSRLDQVRWTIDFLEKKKELKALNEEAALKAKEIFVDINKLIKNFQLAEKAFGDSTYGNYIGFENEELLWLKSRLCEILDLKDDKIKTDKETIALISNKKLSDTRPGEILLAISYLREAGDIKKVESLYDQLIKKYPSTYVYFEKYARFAQKNKEQEKALSLTNEALKFSEGNEPQLNLLKSQILKELNKKTEALAVIDETLKAENINHKRFARIVKKLNDLKTEIGNK